MEPRLKTSKKWTSFPQEYLEQIQAVFDENFAQFLDDAEILIEGRIYADEILFRAGFHEKGRLGQANFEFSAAYTHEEGHALQQIHLCVDAAASMLLEYLEEKKTDNYPYLWKEVFFGNHSLYFKFSTENSQLEAEANKLLGQDFSDMVQEEENDEDALSRAIIDEELSPEASDEDWEDADTGEIFEVESSDEDPEDDSGSDPRGTLH